MNDKLLVQKNNLLKCLNDTSISDSQKISTVKSIIDYFILWNLSEKEFNKELVEIVREHGNIFDTHDGEEFIKEKSQWTKDYYDDLQAKMLSNYSYERVLQVIEVGYYIENYEKSNTKYKQQEEKLDSINLSDHYISSSERVKNNNDVKVHDNIRIVNFAPSIEKRKVAVNFTLAVGIMAIMATSLFLLRKNR